MIRPRRRSVASRSSASRSGHHEPATASYNDRGAPCSDTPWTKDALPCFLSFLGYRGRLRASALTGIEHCRDLDGPARRLERRPLPWACHTSIFTRRGELVGEVRRVPLAPKE